MPDSVYISSTYEDLKEFRQAIFECLGSLSDHYTPVGMEYYWSEDKHFIEKCLDDIKKCDIYILLLGKRYGYVPYGYSKSITEMEYETALAGQKAGLNPKEILVFKVGDSCDTYNYQEKNEVFSEHNQQLVLLTERLSREFNSKAELQLQVSMSLMKRVFRLINAGVKVVPPDKDAVICFCDRNEVFDKLKAEIRKKKRLFFLKGSRLKDFPVGIVKRFSRYNLGSENKVDPIISIHQLSTSCDPEDAYRTTFDRILEYIGTRATDDNLEMAGFLKELGCQKSKNVILPFYYDAGLDPSFDRLKEFLCFLEAMVCAYKEMPAQEYELYLLIVIYSAQPDGQMITDLLAGHPVLNEWGGILPALRPVFSHDVFDWLERYICTAEQSASIFCEYFGDDDSIQLPMQAVNVKLDQMIDDLRDGKDRIKQYL
jgi:hypothetical protein